MKDFNAFISHASEDKMYFVRPLANKLQEYGARIWYDEFSLKPGISLSRSIEKGLASSQFGLVILSESFFKKSWTEFELRALNAYEVSAPGTIIPIWYKVDLDQVRNFSPYLSDKLAIVSGDKTIDEIAIEILETIREDLFEEVLRKRAWSELVAKSEIREMTIEEAKKIKPAPIRHGVFEIQLLVRIRLIRIALFEVYPHSFNFWLDGFQRDLHPEDEIHIWEKIVTCYSESIIALEIFDYEKRKEVYSLTLGLFSALKLENIETTHLSGEERTSINEICKYAYPIYDVNDEFLNTNINS